MYSTLLSCMLRDLSVCRLPSSFFHARVHRGFWSFCLLRAGRESAYRIASRLPIKLGIFLRTPEFSRCNTINDFDLLNITRCGHRIPVIPRLHRDTVIQVVHLNCIEKCLPKAATLWRDPGGGETHWVLTRTPEVCCVSANAFKVRLGFGALMDTGKLP